MESKCIRWFRSSPIE